MSPSVNLRYQHVRFWATSVAKKNVKVDSPGKNASEEDQAGTEEDTPPEFRGANFFSRIMLRDIDVGCLCEEIGEGGESGQDSHGSRWSRASIVNYGCAKLKARESRIVTFTLTVRVISPRDSRHAYTYPCRVISS